jgi:hypothetical protein
MRLTFLFKENRLVTDSLGFLLQKVVRALHPWIKSKALGIVTEF